MENREVMIVSAFDHSVCLASNLASCCEIVKDIVAAAEAYGFDRQDRSAIAVAAVEALTNAIEHGNRSVLSKKVRIEYSVNAQEVRIRITDEGPGFDPESVPDPRLPEKLELPRGRGLLLMRHFMSGIRFNSAGNQIELWKRRSY